MPPVPSLAPLGQRARHRHYRSRGASAVEYIVVAAAFAVVAAVAAAAFGGGVVQGARCLASRMGVGGASCASGPSSTGELRAAASGGPARTLGNAPELICDHSGCYPEGDACFVAGTPVATPYGPVAIEELAAGDEVLAVDTSDPARPIAARRVLGTKITEDQPVFALTVRRGEARDVVHVTGEHPFLEVFADGGAAWRGARWLAPDVALATFDGAAQVTALEATSTRARVYNLEVAGLHTYVVGTVGLVVHNDYYDPESEITRAKLGLGGKGNREDGLRALARGELASNKPMALGWAPGSAGPADRAELARLEARATTAHRELVAARKGTDPRATAAAAESYRAAVEAHFARIDALRQKLAPPRPVLGPSATPLAAEEIQRAVSLANRGYAEAVASLLVTARALRDAADRNEPGAAERLKHFTENVRALDLGRVAARDLPMVTAIGQLVGIVPPAGPIANADPVVAARYRALADLFGRMDAGERPAWETARSVLRDPAHPLYAALVWKMKSDVDLGGERLEMVRRVWAMVPEPPPIPLENFAGLRAEEILARVRAYDAALSSEQAFLLGTANLEGARAIALRQLEVRIGTELADRAAKGDKDATALLGDLAAGRTFGNLLGAGSQAAAAVALLQAPPASLSHADLERLVRLVWDKPYDEATRARLFSHPDAMNVVRDKLFDRPGPMLLAVRHGLVLPDAALQRLLLTSTTQAAGGDRDLGASLAALMKQDVRAWKMLAAAVTRRGLAANDAYARRLLRDYAPNAALEEFEAAVARDLQRPATALLDAQQVRFKEDLERYLFQMQQRNDFYGASKSGDEARALAAHRARLLTQSPESIELMARKIAAERERFRTTIPELVRGALLTPGRYVEGDARRLVTTDSFFETLSLYADHPLAGRSQRLEELKKQLEAADKGRTAQLDAAAQWLVTRDEVLAARRATFDKDRADYQESLDRLDAGFDLLRAALEKNDGIASAIRSAIGRQVPGVDSVEKAKEWILASRRQVADARRALAAAEIDAMMRSMLGARRNLETVARGVDTLVPRLQSDAALLKDVGTGVAIAAVVLTGGGAVIVVGTGAAARGGIGVADDAVAGRALGGTFRADATRGAVDGVAAVASGGLASRIGRLGKGPLVGAAQSASTGGVFAVSEGGKVRLVDGKSAADAARAAGHTFVFVGTMELGLRFTGAGASLFRKSTARLSEAELAQRLRLQGDITPAAAARAARDRLGPTMTRDDVLAVEAYHALAARKGWRPDPEVPSIAGLETLTLHGDALTLAPSPKVFPTNARVRVPRSSGAVDANWTIDGILPDGSIRVVSADRAVSKVIAPEVLLEHNPHLLVGLGVRTTRSSGVVEDNWRVVEASPGVVLLQQPSTGIGRVIDSANLRAFIAQNADRWSPSGAKLLPEALAAGPARVTSAPARRTSEDYRLAHRVGENQRIQDGFVDGGRGMSIAADGRVTSGREILLVDRARDPVLRQHLEYARELGLRVKAGKLGEEEAYRELARFIDRAMSPGGNRRLAHAEMDRWLPNVEGREMLLGDVTRLEAGMCRHRSLLFKVLGDELGEAAGRPGAVALVRGNMLTRDGAGGHAWNELTLANGEKVLVDVMNPRPNFAFPPVSDAATKYFKVDGSPWYGSGRGAGGAGDPGASLILDPAALSLERARALAGVLEAHPLGGLTRKEDVWAALRAAQDKGVADLYRAEMKASLMQRLEQIERIKALPGRAAEANAELAILTMRAKAAGFDIPELVAAREAARVQRAELTAAVDRAVHLGKDRYPKHFRAKDDASASAVSSAGNEPVGQFLPSRFGATPAGDAARKALERAALLDPKAIRVENGGAVHVYWEAPEIVGFSGGQPTRWMRVELSGNEVHSHPRLPELFPGPVQDQLRVRAVLDERGVGVW